MMASFEFATANRILFGAGALAQAAAVAASLGTRALVVTGANQARAQILLDALAEEAIHCETFSVPGEPTVEHIRRGAAHARATESDVIIGLGGGSALDAAKAISALLTNEGDPLDYLEVIGRGQTLQQPAAPCIAIPTTAGTGSEVTRNAVLASPEHRVKVSLRSPSMLPRVAIVDPTLTHSTPPAITAATGMDALIQNLEPLVSSQANPLTDGIAREGLRRAAHSLRRACEEDDPAAGVAWIHELVDDLEIPGLGTYGITADDFPTIIEKSANSSSMKGNPLPLTPDEMSEILQRAL